jgi:hypothetical protein
MRTSGFLLLITMVYAISMFTTSDDVWKPITNINDTSIQELGQCAVLENDRQTGDHSMFIRVVTGTEQGDKYELLIFARELEPKCFIAVVSNSNLDEPENCKLISFKPCKIVE